MLHLLCTAVLLLPYVFHTSTLDSLHGGSETALGKDPTQVTSQRSNTEITYTGRKYYVQRHGFPDGVTEVDDNPGASDELYTLWRRILPNQYESIFRYPPQSTLHAIDDFYNKRHSIDHFEQQSFSNGELSKRNGQNFRGVVRAVLAGSRFSKLLNELRTGAAGKPQSADVSNGISSGKKRPYHVEQYNKCWLESIRDDKVHFKVIRTQGHGNHTIMLIHARLETNGTEVEIEGNPGLEKLIDAAINDAISQQADNSLKFQWIRQTIEFINDTKKVSPDAASVAHASQIVLETEPSLRGTRFVEGLADSTTAGHKKALIINTIELEFTNEAFVVMMKTPKTQTSVSSNSSAGIRATLTKGQDMFIINQKHEEFAMN